MYIYMYVYKEKLTARSREVKMDKTKEDEEKPFHLREEREEGERASVFPNALLGNCLLLRFVGPGTWARPLAQRTTQIHRGSNRYLERRQHPRSWKWTTSQFCRNFCRTSIFHFAPSWSYSTNDDMSVAQGKYRRLPRRNVTEHEGTIEHAYFHKKSSSNLEKSIVICIDLALPSSRAIINLMTIFFLFWLILF